MTEAEAIASVTLLGDGAVSTLAVYVSVTFAYLTLAYFVGSALSRFQVAAISGLYIAFAAIAGMTCVSCVEAWETIVATTPTVLNTVSFFSVGLWHKYMSGLLMAGMVVSLYFMYDVRQKAKK